MVFSSTVFLFFFLPIVLIGYYLLRTVKGRNVWLLAVSLFFYFWGGSQFFLVLIYSICLNYVGGRIIGSLKTAEKKRACQAFFLLILVCNLCNLGYWKYTKFLMQTWGNITGISLHIPDIVLPIGISFFTFQGMSYLIDVYRGDVPVQKNLLRLGLYISLFPQLIAGPIVRYSDIEKQLQDRKHSVDDFSAGIRLFAVGLAKKAVLANSLAIFADKIFGMPYEQNEPAVAWVGLLGYSLQIYFDFSGYSDMAVGLGRMFGFRFAGNFNYPYISCSPSEIWRRWHISLSTWFKDYVYIPLGGSRTGNVYLHLLCVFILTGIWHGASWNYVLWGLFWGVAVVAERFLSDKIKRKISVPRVILWMFTMFLWLMGMTIFGTETLHDCIQYFQSLFGILPLHNVGFSISYYIHRYEVFIIAVSLFAMLPLGKYFLLWLQKKLPETHFTLVENIGAVLLLGISAIYVITGTYNPFIYFQF